MLTRWHYFFPAAFFGGYLLISNGVPPLPVLLGISAAGALTWFKYRKATR